jgi:Trypsin
LFALTFGLSNELQAQTPTPPENIGKVRQPLITNTLVDVDTQKTLGLVTVTGLKVDCSGTLINQYWVLTADHCVDTENAPIPESLTIFAAWSPNRFVTPTRLVRNWREAGLDVALIFLGNGDFGDRPMLLLNHSGLEDGSKVRKFGSGISAFAKDGSPPTPAMSGGGLYRTADFKASSITSTGYDLPANDKGEVGAAGDSGGPDWAVTEDGELLSLAGVQSSCHPTGYVAGQSETWMWATGISSCRSAPIWNVDFEIKEIASPEHVALLSGLRGEGGSSGHRKSVHGMQFLWWSMDD